jgi:predicted HAD superfamily Cof-like phosphohydrolase
VVNEKSNVNNNKVRLMKNKIEAVKAFHEAFKLDYRDSQKADLGMAKNTLRFNLMKEENEEYLEAANNDDLVEVADALGDMLYILCGTIIEHGLQYKIEDVFNEIQRSNMSKLGENGKPIYREDGKVLKGPNYFKPNIAAILSK